MRNLALQVLTYISILSLVACTMSYEASRRPTVDSEKLESTYSSEPYRVRPVDRHKFEPRFWPVTVRAPLAASPGTILVDTKARFLYLIQRDGTARRYGIAVGASGYNWSGTANIGRKTKWPAWYPTDDMRNQTPNLPRRIEPGEDNPLGARALYLFQNGRDTLYRIHGTSEPWTIGTEASSGCIRMLNQDIIELYENAQIGGRVIVR